MLADDHPENGLGAVSFAVSRENGRIATDHARDPVRHASPIVLVIEMDVATRDEYCNWLKAINISAISSAPGEALAHAAAAHCVVINTAIPTPADSAALIGRLLEANHQLQIVCVGTCSEVSVIVQLVRVGARDFLTAPVSPAALAEAVRYQINRRQALEKGRHPGGRSGKISLLTPREREILNYVVRGYSTKQIAAAVGRVEKTIEFHRHNLMRKLGASNAAQLVHMAMLDAGPSAADLGRPEEAAVSADL